MTPIDPLNQSKELSKSTLKMSKPAKEREREIHQQNNVLLSKMLDIIKRKKGTSHTSKSTNGVFNYNQTQPIIQQSLSNRINTQTSNSFINQNNNTQNVSNQLSQSSQLQFKTANFNGTLNFYQRKKELYKINQENQILLRTIQGAQPTYTRVDWRQHTQKFKKYRKQIATTRHSQTVSVTASGERYEPVKPNNGIFYQHSKTPVNPSQFPFVQRVSLNNVLSQKKHDNFMDFKTPQSMTQQLNTAVTSNSKRFQNPQTPSNQNFYEQQNISAISNNQTNYSPSRIDTQEHMNNYVHAQTSGFGNSKYTKSPLVGSTIEPSSIIVQEQKMQWNQDPQISNNKIAAGQVRTGDTLVKNDSNLMPKQSYRQNQRSQQHTSRIVSNLLENSTQSKYVKPSTASAYAEILKIYYPQGKVPKFNFMAPKQPLSKLINNMTQRASSQLRKRTPAKVNQWMQGNSHQELFNETSQNYRIPQFHDQQSNQSNNNINQSPFDFEFSPQYQKTQPFILSEESDQKRQQLMSRQGRRKVNGNTQGDSEIKMLRNRRVDASNGKTANMNIFDDRFELESTSEPEDEDDRDIDGGGINLDDSGINQTNYYNNGTEMNERVYLRNFDQEDRSQILHTQPFEESLINTGQEGQTSYRGYRDNLNMSQPVPRLDNSSMLQSSVNENQNQENTSLILKDLLSQQTNKNPIVEQTPSPKKHEPFKLEQDEEIAQDQYNFKLEEIKQEQEQQQDDQNELEESYLPRQSSATQQDRMDLYRNGYQQEQQNSLPTSRMLQFEHQTTFNKVHSSDLKQEPANRSITNQEYTFTHKDQNNSIKEFSALVLDKPTDQSLTIGQDPQLIFELLPQQHVVDTQNDYQDIQHYEEQIEEGEDQDQDLDDEQYVEDYEQDQQEYEDDEVHQSVKVLNQIDNKNTNANTNTNNNRKYIDSDADADANEYEEINDEILDEYD
ncbi:UNKNOWN [Stylonychia lemnae]|uniref:Uncharacterized protein n=1 Tax=Stylonychia lemnae TaxID=5949 RepID=A0A078AKB1_STYLE|nr:UNKNOWN [Stylonychia lemnae]|eukprot:CDW82629.1 UNKNOWN [Stylonychia lemnae]